MPGIAVVTNPRSRQNRRNPAIAGQLAYMLGDRGEVAQPNSREELVETARRFRDRGVDILAINGGDGTAHVVLSAFVAAWGNDPLPQVALLRGGTMNTVAHSLGVRGKPAELLGALVARYHSGEPLPTVERNLLCVEGEEPHYGFLFGNGLISNYLELYYEGSEPSPAKAAWLLARGILSTAVGGDFGRRLMRPVEVEVEADGRKWSLRPYLSVAAGTVDQIGLGFSPFYEAPRHPGHMHMLGIGCTPLDFVWNLPRVWMSKAIDAPNVYAAVTSEFRMRAESPIGYMVDGDFHRGEKELCVRVGPRLRLLV